MSKSITFRPTNANSNLVKDLAELAKKDNRNLNNYIETVLLAHVNKNKPYHKN